MKGVTCLSKDDTTAVLHVTRQGKGHKRSLYDVLNYCSYALVILAYFQSSRGLEVASKSSVLSVAYHKVQSPGGGGLPYGTDGDARRKF